MIIFQKSVFVVVIWSLFQVVVADDGLFPYVPLTDYDETTDTNSVTVKKERVVKEILTQKIQKKDRFVQSTTTTSLEQARKNIQKNLKSIPADSIQPSEIKGLYKVFVPPRIFYISADGLFAVDGSIIDLKRGVNLTQIEKQKSIVTAIDALGENSMVVFSPKQTKHTVSVFTDIDCGYCRKLHKAIPEYNKLGIKIRYLAYPRAGLGSSSYKKAVSVWCNDDRRDAMTKAKNGMNLAEENCENPVTKHMKLGELIGITGTPAMVLDNGQLIPGFVPPARLSAILNRPVVKK